MSEVFQCVGCGAQVRARDLVTGAASRDSSSREVLCEACTARQRERQYQPRLNAGHPKEQPAWDFRSSPHLQVAYWCIGAGTLTIWILGLGSIFFAAASILSIIAMLRDFPREGTVVFVASSFLATVLSCLLVLTYGFGLWLGVMAAMAKVMQPILP